jgi:flagellar secretion chaperone FliS
MTNHGTGDTEGNGLPPMTNSTILRARYVSNSVDTMSPGRLIVALYDRLMLDLDRARRAVHDHDIAATHESLVHAQAIVIQLHDSLDVTQWPPAHGLADLYLFVYGELVRANVEKDVARIDSCEELLAPLRDAWYQAAGIVAPARDAR